MAFAEAGDKEKIERRRPAGRIGSLDGARGLAALVVVVHHALLASWPSLANGYFDIPPRRSSMAWWLYDTPLHWFWAGPEAVVVFFVLSGFVLALPAVKKGVGWISLGYYPKRLIRLYLPVWGALIFAVTCREIEPRVKSAGTSLWLQSHAVPMTSHGLLTQASLRDQGTFAFDPVLWSLHWEVLYSVLLPVALIPPLLTRRRPLAALAVAATALSLTGLGAAEGSARLTYLPMFLIGALLGFHAGPVTRRLAAWSHLQSTGIAALALCLVTAVYWMHDGSATSTVQTWIAGTAKVASVVGAALLILLALSRPRPLEGRTARWLGSRSYSLYLVHEPIVVTVAFVLGSGTPVPLFLALVLPTALLGAEIFWRAVENPSVRAAHAAARAADAIGHRVRLAGVQRKPAAAFFGADEGERR